MRMRGHSVALGGLGSSQRSRQCAPEGGHAVMSASNVRRHGTHVGGLANIGDTSQGCDMSGHMVPCWDDMVLDGLWAARPASDRSEGVSKVQTHHLACGMAMETSHDIGGHHHILTMAMQPWRPCQTCVDLSLCIPEACSSHGDMSWIVMHHRHIY